MRKTEDMYILAMQGKDLYSCNDTIDDGVTKDSDLCDGRGSSDSESELTGVHFETKSEML